MTWQTYGSFVLARFAALFTALAPTVLASTALGQEPAASSGGLDFDNLESECAALLLLPEPTGHHQVGRLTFHWVDPARPDTISADPDDLRQGMADVYYPAVRSTAGPRAAYLPELDWLRRGFGSDTRELPRRIARDIAVHGCVLTSAFPDIAADPQGAPYPVLLFSPGGNMSRRWHAAWAQDMASRGYVVAVLSHQHSGLDVFPRGGFLMSAQWQAGDDAGPAERRRLDDELAGLLAGDASFALDRLAEAAGEAGPGRLEGLLDLERVAVAGHSRGGSTVGRACADDSRFDVCIVYDNIGPDREIASGLARPQLVIRRPWDADRVETLTRYLEQNRSAAYDIEIDGAIHMSFTDLPFVEPERHEAELDADRVHEITTEVTAAFLDRHLGREGAPAARESDPVTRESDPVAVAEAFEPVSARTFGSAAPDRSSGRTRPDALADDSRSPSSDANDPGAAGDPRDAGDSGDPRLPPGVAAARAYADGVGTDAYLLLRDGRVVDAYGDVAAEYRLHSVRKSLLGTLYGIVLAEGRADTSRSLAELGIDEDMPLTAEEGRATVADLLASRSGVYRRATHENAGWDDVRPAPGSHLPGTHWFYSNWDFNAAGTALQIMTGEGLFETFKREIAEPLGMEDFTIEDGAWRYGSRSRHPAYVFRMSTRDLARFGRLMLQGGSWNGEEVVPAEWVAQVTRPRSRASRPDGTPMPGVHYGLSWWVPPAQNHGVEIGPGAFEASGTGTQLLLVAPARGLVYVHRNDTDVPSEEYRGVSVPEAYEILRLLIERPDGDA